MDTDLVLHVARFAGVLRRSGISVGIGDEVDAATALMLIDLFDPAEVHRALRTALKIRRRDWELFDAAFATFGASAPETPSPVRAARAASPLGVVRRSIAEPEAFSRSTGVPPGEGHFPGYSPEVLLRRKPFEFCSTADLARMERLLARAVTRLATRKSRRLQPTRGRGVADVRRSFRRSLATGGELVALARRARRIEQPEVLLLCDTSGSMDAHSRFLLAFAVALKKVARRTEVFTFNTSLTRVTRWLAPGKIAVTLERLATGVPDWSGGTRIGETLTEFVARYQHELVTPRTVVIIVSDGLDRGNPILVSGAMRAIRARAKRVIWLNPLAADARYQPTARAMQAALPYVDRLAGIHTLDTLERLLPEVIA